MASARDKGFEPRAERPHELRIGGSTHHSIGLVLALPCELADEIPDIGPDAVVV